MATEPKTKSAESKAETSFYDAKGKSFDQQLVELSHLYRRMMNQAPSFVFHENYKGTPDSPKAIKNHDYTIDIGGFSVTEKGSVFTSWKQGTGDNFSAALTAIVKQLNAEW